MEIKNKKFGKGFTLIELLVVVAIISLMSSVILASLNTARSKARDGKRREEIHQIQNALEIYYNTNGQYPASGGATNPTVPTSNYSNSGDASWTALQTALSPYLPVLPKDPTDNATFPAFLYTYYSGDGCGQQWYMLVYSLENASGPDNGVKSCNNTYQWGGGTSKTAIKTVGVSYK